jgi:uncharacterized protein
MTGSAIHEFADAAVDPEVRGFLHVPDTPSANSLVLTHGAGGNAQAPLLVALADIFVQAGFTVLRCNLPYRQRRSFGPPGPGDAARDRAGLKNAVACVREIVGAPLVAGPRSRGNLPAGFDRKSNGRIFLAGHSYGGRQSSMLCAEEPDLVAGLMLLSYPLHPPRRSEQQRTQHFPDLRTPSLFIHGTRDPFGTIEELQKGIKMIPAKTRLAPIEGAGHDLGFKGNAKKREIPELVFPEFTRFFELSS